MTLKEYIKFNSKNTLLVSKRYDFNEIYNLYIDFKTLGKYLCKYDFNKILILDNKLKFKWPFITINNSDERLTNFINQSKLNNIENKITNNEIASLSTFIYLISSSIKQINIEYSYSEIMNKLNMKISRLLNIYINNNIQEFTLDNLTFIPTIIDKLYKKNYLFGYITEDLIYDDELAILVDYINFKNILSLFMHFIKLELMYYTSQINESRKIKICPGCHESKLFSGKKCKECKNKENSKRRNINKKCNTIRNKLQQCISFDESIPYELKMKICRMLEEKHSYIQYNELKRLLEEVEKRVK